MTQVGSEGVAIPTEFRSELPELQRAVDLNPSDSVWRADDDEYVASYNAALALITTSRDPAAS